MEIHFSECVTIEIYVPLYEALIILLCIFQFFSFY